MPFIDCRITQKLTEEQKVKLKSEFGKAMSVVHKPESYLMVGIADNYDLYFAGKKLENGAYVALSLFGSATPSAYEKMTEVICGILETELGIDGASVYVTYHEVDNWGWNGANF